MFGPHFKVTTGELSSIGTSKTKSLKPTQIATCCKMTRHKLSLVDRRIAGYTHLQTGRSFRALSRHCNRVAVLHADDMRL